MVGNVTPLDGKTPAPKLREITSYELTPLFSNYGGAGERYLQDDLAARFSLAIYTKMMTDEQVKAVVQFKRDAISSRGYQFAYADQSPLDPEEKARRVAIMDRIVNKMRGSFEDALNGVVRGRVYGYSMTEIVLDTVKIEGKSYVGINSLLSRDPTTFKFYTDRYGSLDRCVQRIAGAETQIDLARFIHYVHAPEEDRYLGLSDLRQAYRWWYIKDQVARLYPLYLERFAGGFGVASVTAEAGIVAGSKEHEELKAVLRNIRSTSGILLPPGVTLDIKMPTSSGEYREALQFCDLAIAKSLLVPNLLGISHTGQTGAYSQSQTQLEAFFWTLNADTRRLEACLNEQLFRQIGDQNFGDGEYPEFKIKPASQEQVRWIVNTWKDLVGAKAVQPTAEDEAYLRELLEMPSRKEEGADGQEQAVPSDPSAAFTGVQITAMLDVLQRVGEGKLPKETAVLVLVQSFPITEEDARAMLAPILEGSIKPPPPPQALLPGTAAQQVPDGDGKDAEDDPADPADGAPDAQKPAGDSAAGADGKPPLVHGRRVVAHTHDGKPRTVPMTAFYSAVARCDFALIEKRGERIAEDGTSDMARAVAKAVWRILENDTKMAELIDAEMGDIEYVKLDGADVGKIKSICKDSLSASWLLGVDTARREVERAGAKMSQATVTQFASLRDKAAQYFESNGFRMAANVSDGARGIIQQELINAVKEGLGVPAARERILNRLASRGFTSVAAIEREVTDATLAKAVANALGSAGVTEDTAAAYLNTLIRTNTFEALNEARFAEFTDPALQGFVQAFEYSAILDDVTTDLCASLNGEVWAADAPEWESYRPPNHFNCRSVMIPVTLADDWSGTSSPEPKLTPAAGFGGT